jgi:hypothetical protein
MVHPTVYLSLQWIVPLLGYSRRPSNKTLPHDFCVFLVIRISAEATPNAEHGYASSVLPYDQRLQGFKLVPTGPPVGYAGHNLRYICYAEGAGTSRGIAYA